MQNAKTFYKELVSLTIPWLINLCSRFKMGERGRKSVRGGRGRGVWMKGGKTYFSSSSCFASPLPNFACNTPGFGAIKQQ